MSTTPTPDAATTGNVNCPVHGSHGLQIGTLCGRCVQDGTPVPFQVRPGPPSPPVEPPPTDTTGGTV